MLVQGTFITFFDTVVRRPCVHVLGLYIVVHFLLCLDPRFEVVVLVYRNRYYQRILNCLEWL
jgi:hypothetical protein